MDMDMRRDVIITGMTLDNLELPDDEIELLIAERCSACGLVAQVSIYRAPAQRDNSIPPSHDFAIVVMASGDSAAHLHRLEGGSRSGNHVLFPLTQAGKSGEPPQ